MPKYGSILVNVTIDGHPLPEYATEVNEAATDVDQTAVVCWIPSRLGQVFEVLYENNEGYELDDGASSTWISARLKADGEVCGHRLLHPSTASRAHQHLFPGLRTSATTILPLRFAKHRTSSDDEMSHRPQQHEQGDIVLVIALKVPIRASSGIPGKRDPTKDLVYPERDKKALGHSVGFGAEILTDRINYQRLGVRTIRKLATFTFKYRPIEMLVANGIAPPSSIPEPTDHLEEKRVIRARNTLPRSLHPVRRFGRKRDAELKKARNDDVVLNKIRQLKDAIDQLEREKKIIALKRELEAEQKHLKAKDKGSIKGKRHLAARKKR